VRPSSSVPYVLARRDSRICVRFLVMASPLRAEIDTLDAFASLVDNSLVWRVGQPEAVRFALPVTIREYAAAQLREAGETDAVVISREDLRDDGGTDVAGSAAAGCGQSLARASWGRPAMMTFSV